MKFLFLIDEPKKISVQKDTSFALIEESFARGHEIFYLPRGEIRIENGLVFFKTIEIIPDRRKKDFLALGKTHVFSAKDIDVVFIRLEPPFHLEYLNYTWFLDIAKKNCFVVNDPSGVRSVNEKIWATWFSKLLPNTCITCSKENCLGFLEKEKEIIAKPLDGFGGSGVFKLKLGDTNSLVTLELLSKNFSEEIMLQSYVSAASSHGDKRILLLNGEILGSVLRVASSEDHRNNFFTGGKAEAAKITVRDKQIVAELSPYLKKLGLYFVGIDIIGEYLIEVNVTSPTGIQEASHFSNQNLSAKVIDFTEKQVKLK